MCVLLRHALFNYTVLNWRKQLGNWSGQLNKQAGWMKKIKEYNVSTSQGNFPI